MASKKGTWDLRSAPHHWKVGDLRAPLHSCIILRKGNGGFLNVPSTCVLEFYQRVCQSAFKFACGWPRRDRKIVLPEIGSTTRPSLSQTGAGCCYRFWQTYLAKTRFQAATFAFFAAGSESPILSSSLSPHAGSLSSTAVQLYPDTAVLST